MRSFLDLFCGKRVNNKRQSGWITCDALSTPSDTSASRTTPSSVKAEVLLSGFPLVFAGSSPAQQRILPLIEHYLYPVSTAPIINTTNVKN